LTAKQKTISFIVIAVVFVLLLSALFLFHNVMNPLKPAEEDEPISEVLPAEAQMLTYADISQLPVDGKTFIYLASEDGIDYLVDIAHPQVQISVTHTESSPDFSMLNQYTVIGIEKSVPDDTSSKYQISSSYYNWSNLGGSVQTAPAEAEGIVYAQEFMNSFVYTSNYGLAVTDFTVNSAKLEAVGESGHIYSLSLNVDVKPQKNEFNKQLGYLWGETDADGYVRNVNLSTILYYYNNKWGSMIYPDHASPFITGIDFAITVPQTEYIYKTKDVLWEKVWNEGAPIEQVFYEDDSYSYISHSVFKWQEPNISGNFTTLIYKLERTTGAKQLLFTMPQNQLYPEILLKAGNTVLMNCKETNYPSGADKGHIFILDLVNGAYKEALPLSLPILVKEDTVYAVCMEGNDIYKQGIYEILFNNKEFNVKRLGDLPGRTFSAQYESCYITHLNKTTNEMYLMWPDDMMDMALYKFNLTSGLSSKVE
jgi:hypothetical protein